MALVAGDSNCTTGLSKRIRDALIAGGNGVVDNAALKALSYAIATAVVAEIQANAAVSATIVTTCPAGAGTGVLATGVT